MLTVRRMKQVLVLASLSVAVWLGAIVMLKRLPDLDRPGSPAGDYSPPSADFLRGQQLERKELMARVCRMSGRTDDGALEDREALDHLIVDDQHGLIYCYVPKVACTNWKRVLMVLMHKSNTSDPLQIVADDSHRLHVFRRLSNYSADEANYRLRNYMKFMFVRHPFERLLSAYRNKFSQNYSTSEYFRIRYGRQIIKQFRPNASDESLSRGHDVTFREFVRYIIDPRTASRTNYNEHWRPMVELCHPCRIDYDVIGKYETLMDDAWLVLDKANLTGVVQFPRSDKPSATGALIDQYLAMLTPQERLHLYHVYELDFRLFDYHADGLT